MNKKILITGGSGLIGSYFIKSNIDKFAKGQIVYPTHQEMDITNLDSVIRYFEKHKPTSVIHFAAFRNASEAEKQRNNKSGSVWKVNVEGTSNLAKVSKKYNSYLIYISTDYVFSGHKKNKGPYSEKDKAEDSTHMLTWYGITKREAEKILQENFNKASIIRICNITREDNDPKLDYVGKILWLYDQKIIYPMFTDQFLTLTYIPVLAEIITKLIKGKLPGIFHVSTNNLVTPHQLANYLIERVYGKVSQVSGISIDSYLKTNPRRYPKYGGLIGQLTQKKLDIKPISWQEVIEAYATSVKRKKRKTP